MNWQEEIRSPEPLDIVTVLVLVILIVLAIPVDIVIAMIAVIVVVGFVEAFIDLCFHGSK
jgi:hypothetical protein